LASVITISLTSFLIRLFNEQINVTDKDNKIQKRFAIAEE
jgi:hypothetical protein